MGTENIQEILGDVSTQLQDGVAMSEFPEKEGWEKTIRRMLIDAGFKNIQFKMNNSGVRIISFIRSELAQAKEDGYNEGAHEASMVCNEHTVPMAVKLERTAWLAQERCHLCGEGIKNDGLSDMCSKCFETA